MRRELRLTFPKHSSPIGSFRRPTTIHTTLHAGDVDGSTMRHERGNSPLATPRLLERTREVEVVTRPRCRTQSRLGKLLRASSGVEFCQSEFSTVAGGRDCGRSYGANIRRLEGGAEARGRL